MGLTTGGEFSSGINVKILDPRVASSRRHEILSRYMHPMSRGIFLGVLVIVGGKVNELFENGRGWM